MKPIKISVIIPTYNEEEDISNAIKSLLIQSEKNIEIIIVDDGSTDKTREIVKKFKKVRLILGKHRGPGISRNLGAKKAYGKILVFVDADMTFEKNYLKNLIKPIESSKEIIGTTHNYEVIDNTNNIWSRCWGKVRVNEKEGYGNSVIFRAILKKKFLEMGGFNPKYGYADDQTFFIERKIKPYVARDTTCYHKNPETLKAVYKQSRWIGASLNNKFLNMPLIKKIIPFLMILVSPISIILLSIKKASNLNEWKIFFPYMLLFITARYFGTLEGITRKVYFGKNFK